MHKIFKSTCYPQVLTLFLLALVVLCEAGNSEMQDMIKQLRTKILESQVKEDTTFIPGEQWDMQKGIYPSHLMINFAGGPEEHTLRNSLRVFDNNVCVTGWVTQMQLEASLVPGGPDLEDEQISMLVDVMQYYHDFNRGPGKDSSVIAFWPQQLDESTGVWRQYLSNVGPMAANVDTLSTVMAWVLKDSGLKIESELITEATTIIKELVNISHIPADFDDTSVSLMIGSLLERSKYKAAYSKWLNGNPSIGSVFQLSNKYTYKPFDSNIDKNLVDPRSYYYLRNILLDRQKNNASLRLPMTWATSYTENKLLAEVNTDVVLPHNLNCVALSVIANIMYISTATALSDWAEDMPEDWLDVQRYVDMVDIIVNQMSQNFSGRPDLSNMYYPSKFVLYWWTSRTLQLTKATDKKLPFPEMYTALNTLESYFRNNFTYEFIKEAKHDESGLAYYDDMLGIADKDIFGKHVNHAEDRIYATAMAANALLYTWREGFNLSLETPPIVITTVKQLCGWLVKNTLSGKYKPYNVFFTVARIDNRVSYPFLYPANYQYYFNGTALPPDADVNYPSSAYIAYGMQGVADPEWYNQDLKKEHFGKKLPDFQGFNVFPFGFWCSEEISYAAAMLALTQCNYLFD